VAARTPTQHPAARAEARPARWQRWAVLLLLIGLGAFLRLHALDRLPPGLYHDEAFYGLDAQRVLHGEQFPIFFTGNNGREPLHLYLLAGAMGLLGERVWVLRLVSALAGVLSIPLMYQAGRRCWRWRRWAQCGWRGPGRVGGGWAWRPAAPRC
jgi:4-amino-4-deoxy-L-arabinose transferase-like glycosyltransferase